MPIVKRLAVPASVVGLLLVPFIARASSPNTPSECAEYGTNAPGFSGEFETPCPGPVRGVFAGAVCKSRGNTWFTGVFYQSFGPGDAFSFKHRERISEFNTSGASSHSTGELEISGHFSAGRFAGKAFLSGTTCGAAGRYSVGFQSTSHFGPAP